MRSLVSVGLLLAALLLYLLPGAHTYAQIPRTLSYQGVLTDNDGVPRPDGNYTITFRLYDAASGGAPLWTETQSLQVRRGLFSAVLGSVTPFGSNLTFAQPYWLSLQVSPEPEIPARLPLTSAGYSLNSLGGSGLWNLNGPNIYFDAGNVGIGTSTPNHRLRIAGGPFWTSNSWRGGLEFDNASAIAWRANAAGNRFGIGHTDGGLFFFSTASDPGTVGSPANGRMMIADNGNVGIGTSFPATRLTVRTTGSFERYGIEHTNGSVRLATYLTEDAGWFGTRSAHPLGFFVNNGLPCLSVDEVGNVVMTPNGGTGGYGSTIFGTPAGESGMTIRGGNRADVRFNGSSLKILAGIGTGPPLATSGLAITTAGDVGIGTTSPTAKLDVAGRTKTRTLEITGGSDLAEPFDMEEGIEQGTVMVIDEEKPGKLRTSTVAYDSRVAGIVSGAGGVNPGLTLSQEGVLEGSNVVAIAGRVYCKAEALSVPIQPGDLLTTSNIAGHAMKATDRDKAHGAVIGKAMTSLRQGTGLVLVLVNLQ